MFMISPLNNRFLFKDKYLLGKTNEKSDDLLFAKRGIKEVIIPSYIKIISPEVFHNCKNLRKVTFEENSKLEIIRENAFCYAGIESFLIPSNVSQISKNAYAKCRNLFKVKFEENSKLSIIGPWSFLNSKIINISIPANVIKISQYAFSNCSQLNKVTISSDSKLESIGMFAFSYSLIDEIFIPANARKIKGGCFCYLFHLERIIVSPMNNRFLFKHCLLGKSDENIDDFDVLLYVPHKIREVKIPSNVKIIFSYAFYACFFLRKVILDENSKLEVIGKLAFSHSCIEDFYFPPNLRELEEEWCNNMTLLKKIIVSPLNNRFLYKDDKFLLAKTDEKSDDFNILLFARRDIEEAVIPSNIKIISPKAFFECQNLRKLIIEENSKLEIIGKDAFAGTNIDSFYVPPNISSIADIGLYSPNLKIIEISEESKLESINDLSFDTSFSVIVMIPPKIKKLV